MRIKTFVFYVIFFVIFLAMLLPEQIYSFLRLIGLSAAGFKALLLLILALAAWIFELLPMATTALLVLVLIPVQGIMDFSQTIRYSFGDSILAFFLGVLILSVAFQETGLGRRLAINIFRIFGNKEKNIILGIMISGALLAMWVTEVAAVSIIYPVALGVLEQHNNNKNFGKALMLGVAWGPAFGGVATPIATAANLITIRYMEEYCSFNISFFSWVLIGVPLMLMLIISGWLLLIRILHNGNNTLNLDTNLNGWTKEEIKLVIIFIITIALWLLGSIYRSWKLSSHHVALISSILLFFPGIDILKWENTFKKINWGSIILICSGVAIGKIMIETHVAEWIAKYVIADFIINQSFIVRSFLIVMVIAFIKIIFTSNTITGIIMIPIIISLSGFYHLPPWSLVAPAIFSTALSLISVTSSPVNVIPYASGCFTIKDMAKYGFIMTVHSSFIISVWLWFFLT